MPAQTFIYEEYYEETTFEDIDNHVPNSFVIEKEIENFRRGLITEEGLRNELFTLLEERAQMAVSEFDIFLRNGQLVSPDFNIPLTELYAKPSGDPIYDLRAPYDAEYIRQIEAWANGTLENFSWIRFSPTTGAMSKETKIEFGVRNGNHLRTYVITVPFREEQSREDVFQEVKILASKFNPQFVNAQDEFDMLPHPVLLRELSLDSVLINLDNELSKITGVPYFMGRPREMYNHYEVVQFQKFIEAINQSRLVEQYIMACKLGDIQIAQAVFNKIVNNFDIFWSEGQGDNVDEVAEIINGFVHDISEPKTVAAGCGAAGGGSLNKSSGINGMSIAIYKKALESMGIHLTEKMVDPVLCDDCGSIFFVDNNDPTTWFSNCPFCHSDCVSCG